MDSFDWCFIGDTPSSLPDPVPMPVPDNSHESVLLSPTIPATIPATPSDIQDTKTKIPEAEYEYTYSVSNYIADCVSAKLIVGPTIAHVPIRDSDISIDAAIKELYRLYQSDGTKWFQDWVMRSIPIRI